MKARLTPLAAIFVASAGSLAIALAPAALAQPPQCGETEQGGGEQGGGNTLCESTGNAQIDARPGVLAPGAMGGMGGGGIGGGMGGGI